MPDMKRSKLRGTWKMLTLDRAIKYRLAVARVCVAPQVSLPLAVASRWLRYLISVVSSVHLFSTTCSLPVLSLCKTSPWSSGKCVHLGAGRSRVRLPGGSYQDLVNWYCNLLTRRTVHGRAAGNKSRPQTNRVKWKQTLHKLSRGATRPLQLQSAINKTPYK